MRPDFRGNPFVCKIQCCELSGPVGGLVVSLFTRFEAPVNDCDRNTDIEMLARMAARLAGRDPDEHLRMELAEVVAFDDVLWRYPDFLTRAEAAYEMLHCYPFVQSEQPAEQSIGPLETLRYCPLSRQGRRCNVGTDLSSARGDRRRAQSLPRQPRAAHSCRCEHPRTFDNGPRARVVI